MSGISVGINLFASCGVYQQQLTSTEFCSRSAFGIFARIVSRKTLFLRPPTD
jgi:hypothetical protein